LNLKTSESLVKKVYTIEQRKERLTLSFMLNGKLYHFILEEK